MYHCLLASACYTNHNVIVSSPPTGMFATYSSLHLFYVMKYIPADNGILFPLILADRLANLHNILYPIRRECQCI